MKKDNWKKRFDEFIESDDCYCGSMLDCIEWHGICPDKTKDFIQKEINKAEERCEEKILRGLEFDSSNKGYTYGKIRQQTIKDIENIKNKYQSIERNGEYELGIGEGIKIIINYLKEKNGSI